jgi:uncharacterized protein (TIGR02391 family)
MTRFRLREFLPDQDIALRLEPEELAWYLLEYIRKAESGQFQRHHLVNQYIGGAHPEPANEEMATAVMEAFRVLELRGLVIPAPGDSRARESVLSRRGRSVGGEQDFMRFLNRSALPESILHPDLRAAAWVDYLRGEFDAAVFRAFKAVEVRVRTAGGLAKEDYGVSLMRKAFGKAGALRLKGAVAGEEDAIMNLFAGAIGAFKNPASHRDVGIDDPARAAEALFIASHLLRIVDDRAPPE